MKDLGANEIVFLRESNHIEQEYSDEAMQDAIVAWSYLRGIKRPNTATVRKVHYLLMHRFRPDIAGMWRRVPVWIGGQYKPYTSWHDIEKQVSSVLRKMRWSIERKQAGDRSAGVTARNHHVQFEDIHPFEDGNGRVGRMLMNWQKLQLGSTLLIIHADWPDPDGEQARYYKWFKK